ncbi:hypothetical protein V8F06_000053 [Rhypophila decipiens]
MADSGNIKTTKTTITTTTTAPSPSPIMSSMGSGTGFRNERSDSTSSTGSGSTASSSSSPASPTTSRRASQGLFDSLTAQKRKDDPASIARRQSMNDQQPKSGFIGQMWNNWVHGPGSNK